MNEKHKKFFEDLIELQKKNDASYAVRLYSGGVKLWGYLHDDYFEIGEVDD